MNFFFGIAVLFHLGNRRREIAPIDDDAAERGDLFAESGDAEGGRSHVDATAAAAHVEGDADEMDGRGHGGTIAEDRRPGESEVLCISSS